MPYLKFEPADIPESAGEHHLKAQVASRMAASHHGQEWTSSDWRTLEQEPDNEKAAAKLGRTVAAVANKRRLLPHLVWE
jgi:hypothetical protein